MTITHPPFTAEWTLTVLQQLGFDLCCGGALPLKTAVERHELNLETVLAALRAVIEAP